MRAIGFYGSDYNISDMTIDKFHSLIDQEQIKIVNDSSVTKQIKSEVISAKKQNMAIDFYCTSMKPVISRLRDSHTWNYARKNVIKNSGILCCL
jgi:hypothetical protein